ncbi:MAG TPA: serine hydrolase domain-containing protein [Gemmatimonadaceae bacterium]|nr:serine hydrolase domain-containing protein [Gemmatimonadaceae bacterium]
MTRSPFFTVACALLSAIAAAQEPAKAPISEQELVRRLAASLDSLSRLDQFSGVVAVSRAGKPVFQHAYGMADREARRPNNIETAFNLGSINKLFTATAVRQLAEAGKIDLDSTLARYLPDYSNQDVARRVTIRQIINMKSGIGGDIFGTPAGGKRLDLRHNREFVPLFVHQPLQFDPGTQQRYSNPGYVVLGLVIERVSGEDYYDYVRRHIYEPGGMTRTAHFAVDSLPPNTALGYTRGGEDNPPPDAPLRRNSDMLPGRGSAAGGGYSTAQDLLHFLEAIRAHRIAGAPPSGVGAPGGAPGVNALVEGALPGGYDLIVLSNLDPPSAMRIGRSVRGWLGAPD